ncbi:MAG: GtrA family protein [Oscillospiraceae bacterium]|jgi:putative flippase GtrA|nr:GtrA family protein [Oscillospiraceae bacterium]
MIRNKIRVLYNKIGAEAIRYIIFGVLTTLVNLGLNALLIRVFGEERYWLWNIISIAASILFAYVTNRKFVFNSRVSGAAAIMLEFAKFVGGRLVTFAIEAGGVPLLVEVFGVRMDLAKYAMQVIVIVVNYVISKLLVFRKKPTDSANTEE